MTRLGRPLTVLVLASLWGCGAEPALAPPTDPVGLPAKQATAPQGSVELEEPTIETQEVAQEADAPARLSADDKKPVELGDSTSAPQAEPLKKTSPERRASRTTKPPPPPPPRGAEPIQAATSSGGSISPEAIRSVVRGGITEVRACYERTLAKDPQLSGKVSTSFTIDPTGRVSQVQVNGLRQDLESCLASVIRNWTFPPPSGGGVVRVTYPFVFHPAS